MWQSIKSILKQEKGMAMVAVLGMFVVIMILATSMLVYYRQDVRETIYLENRIKAYYLALSGVELGYAALIVPNNSANPSGPKYIDDFIANTAKVATQDIGPADGLVGGTAAIRIENVAEASGKRWIQVTSVGTLTTVNPPLLVRTRLRIDSTNTSIVIREQPDM